VRRLLANGETKPVFLAALVLGGLALGWSAGSVLAGETLGEQSWLVLVLGCVMTTVLALVEEDLPNSNGSE
jgi:hypothetical protein